MVLKLTVQYQGRRGPLIDGLVKGKGGSKLFLRGDRLGQILPQMRLLFHPNRGVDDFNLHSFHETLLVGSEVTRQGCVWIAHPGHFLGV